MINQIGDMKKENNEESEMKTVTIVNQRVQSQVSLHAQVQVDILCRCNILINHLS